MHISYIKSILLASFFSSLAIAQVEQNSPLFMTQQTFSLNITDVANFGPYIQGGNGTGQVQWALLKPDGSPCIDWRSDPIQLEDWFISANTTYSIWFRRLGDSVYNLSPTYGPSFLHVLNNPTPGSFAQTRALTGFTDTYNYAVTWMIDASENKEKLWWGSGGKMSRGSTYLTDGGDVISYAERPIGGTTWTITPVVLHADHPGSWETSSDGNGGLTCDPTVIKATTGQWFSRPNDPTQYKYLMYYGAFNFAVTPNRNYIALAYSVNGKSWIKSVSNPLIGPGYPGATYGAGQPSVINRNGTLWMFYTDTYEIPDANGAPSRIRYRTCTSNTGAIWSAPVDVSQNGLSIYEKHGGDRDFAYSAADDCWYMTFSEYRPAIQPNGTTEIHVFKIAASQLQAGTWQYVRRVPMGFNRYWKLGPGLRRDILGNLYGGVAVAYGAYDGPINAIGGSVLFSSEGGQ